MGHPARGAALAPAGGHCGDSQGVPWREPGYWTGINLYSLYLFYFIFLYHFGETTHGVEFRHSEAKILVLKSTFYNLLIFIRM